VITLWSLRFYIFFFRYCDRERWTHGPKWNQRMEMSGRFKWKKRCIRAYCITFDDFCQVLWHTSNNVVSTRKTRSNVASTFLPSWATISNENSSFRQSRNKLNMFSFFRLCRKDEILFYFVVNGNIVVATFDFVESTFDFVERIVRLVAFDIVASTLLPM